MVELHIIKTNEESMFSTEMSMDDEGHRVKKAVSFVIRAQEEYSGLKFPLYAIAREQGGLQEHPSVIGVEPMHSDAQGLVDRIDDLVQRREITGVIDFTNGAPHVLAAYELLRDKYDVKIHEVIVIEK